LLALGPSGSGGAWKSIIREHNAMTDEDLVLDGDTFTDECVGGDLASPANYCVFLDFYERTDP
jgi:hypothetical protein